MNALKIAFLPKANNRSRRNIPEDTGGARTQSQRTFPLLQKRVIPFKNKIIVIRTYNGNESSGKDFMLEHYQSLI